MSCKRALQRMEGHDYASGESISCPQILLSSQAKRKSVCFLGFDG